MPVLSGLPGLCGSVCCQSNVFTVVQYRLLLPGCFQDFPFVVNSCKFYYQVTGCGPIFIDFEGHSLHLLDFDVCSLCHIKEILYKILSNIPSAPLSLSSSSGIPIILMLCRLMVSLISQILSSWSSICLSFAQLPYSPSFGLLYH